MRSRCRKLSQRLSWRASTGVTSECASSSTHDRPKPAARAVHTIICRSRRPPGLSLTFGSSAYGVSWNFA